LFATALVAVIAAVALLATPSTSATAAPAGSADSFVDSIGVNIHTVGETPYREQFAGIEQRLGELGVRHVRDELFPGEPDQYEALNQLAADGIGVTTIVGPPSAGMTALEEMVAVLKNDLAGSVEAVEGPNEYSTEGSPDWKNELVAYQRKLYEDVKGDPALSSLPVIGPSISHNDQAQLGDVSSWLDFGNIHSYPEGNGPEYKMGFNLERAELNSASKPIFATETGYTNAINWTPAEAGENRPVPESVSATYMPRLFFEYFSRHIARTYSYELVNQRPDPEADDRESNFGLLRNDLSKKPAFEALANTIAILEDPGPAFTPGALDFSLSGATADLHRVLLQKRDGSFYLALWRITSVWDPVAKTAQNPPSEAVTIAVQPGIESAAEYLPNASTAPVRSLSEPGQSLSVNVGPAIVIVKLTPGDVEPPVEPEPEPEPEPAPESGAGQATAAPAPQDESPAAPETRTQARLRPRPHVTVAVARRAGEDLVLRGRVLPAPGGERPISIQSWSGAWRAIGHGRTSADGSFRRRVGLPASAGERVTRIRIASTGAKPSRTIRVQRLG
jgi:hypothetical protein